MSTRARCRVLKLLPREKVWTRFLLEIMALTKTIHIAQVGFLRKDQGPP